MTKTTIALIDHNDSFTFNVVEVYRKMDFVELTVIPYTDLQLEILIKFDKIILSPGPSLPSDYPKTFQVIEKFYKTKPILGICLGHQAICSFFGAELFCINDVVHGEDKQIQIDTAQAIFNNITEFTEVGLYHSWAVSQRFFSDNLTIIAETAEKMIMSVKHKKFPVYGFQFHPESFLTVDGFKMLENFAKLL